MESHVLGQNYRNFPLLLCAVYLMCSTKAMPEVS